MGKKFLGEDLDQFDLKKSFETNFKHIDCYTTRIDKLLEIKDKNEMMQNQLAQIHYDAKSYIDSGEDDAHKLKVSHNVIDKANGQFKELDRMRLIIDNEIAKEESYVTQLLKKSDGKVDKYGVPEAISYEEYEDRWNDDRTDWLRRETLKELDKDPILKKILEPYKDEITIEDKKNSIEKVLEQLPLLLKLVGENTGRGYQKVIQPLEALYNLGRLKKASGKTGKKYNKERDEKIAQDLMPYWDYKVNDITMPDNHNRESLFYEIANKYGLSFDRIKQLERQLSKKHQPKPLAIDEDYPQR